MSCLALLLTTTLITISGIFAQAESATTCIEENKAVFYSKGAIVPPERFVGKDDCDGFGGVFAYTPAFNIPVYVNYNIEIKINLDEIDYAIGTYTPTLEAFNELKTWQISVLSRSIVNKYPQNNDYRVKAEPRMKSYFVSTRVLDEKRTLAEVWRWMYDPEYDWSHANSIK